MSEENEGNESIQEVLDKYEKAKQGDTEGGLSTVSRTPGKTTATSVIAQVDSKGIYKNNKVKELLVDLSARTNFRSRNERIYFLDWVSWCEEFGVGFDGCIMYISSARSENAESIHQLIEALTSVRQHQYVHSADKGKGLKEGGRPLSS